MKRRTLLAVAALLPAACATSPDEPTAPGSRKRFGIRQFFALDPATLRAAVLTDVRAIFQEVDLDLTARQTPAARYVIRLQRPMAIDPRLPPAPAGQAWQVFALTPEDAATLTTVRQLLLSHPREQAEAFTVTVSARPALLPADLITALPLRIDLLVDNRDGWFTQVGPLLLDTRQGQGEQKG